MEASGIVAAVGPSLTDVVVGEAARLARELDGTLHLVAAYRPASASERDRARRRLPAGLRLDYDDDRLLEARTALEDAGELVGGYLTVRLHLERGDLAAGVCRVAGREQARLIVAAQAEGRMAGRVQARLVELAPCPLRLVMATTGPPVRHRARRPGARNVPAAAADLLDSPALGHVWTEQ